VFRAWLQERGHGGGGQRLRREREEGEIGMSERERGERLVRVRDCECEREHLPREMCRRVVCIAINVGTCVYCNQDRYMCVWQSR